MRRIHRVVSTVAVTCAVTVVSMGDVAAADGAVPLGGGVGIVVDGRYCTLTTIGHDKTGELVGFTASHCGGPCDAPGSNSRSQMTANGVAADCDMPIDRL